MATETPKHLVTRRAVLAGGAALAASPARAAEQMTVADNGGPVGASFREAFYDPFEKATGVQIVNVTQAPDPVIQVKLMVDTKAYTTDVHLLTPEFTYRLTHPKDYLETLDLPASATADLLPQMVQPKFMGTDVWTTVFAYRTDKFGDNGPQSWADFWNVQKFPGRRAMQNAPRGNLEIALMADGVPLEKVYPLDVDRAFASLTRIKPHVDVWWNSGAQSTQLLQSGEVDVLQIWSARAQTTIDAGTPAKIIWYQNIASVDGWGIPKGCPKLDIARKFVAFCADPARQAAYTPTMKNGPTNTRAYNDIPKDRAELLPTYPANRTAMLVRDDAWWGANFDKVKQRFDAWLLEN